MPKKKSPSIKDYSRLPFEVHYAGSLGYTKIEMLSETGNIKNPNDIKGLHIQEGYAYDVTFLCDQNSGSELECCLNGGHDDTQPNWLKIIEESDVDFNHGTKNAVSLDKKGLNLSADCEDEDSLDALEYTGETLDLYHLFNVEADYIILDAFGDRIQVNCEGFRILENGEVDESMELVSPDELREDESLSGSAYAFFDTAQDEWIKSVWKNNFQKDKAPKILKYAF